MLKNLKEKLSGYKTYAVGGAAIAVGVLGYVFGPIDLPGAFDIPALTIEQAGSCIWAGLLTLTGRAAVKSATEVIAKEISKKS